MQRIPALDGLRALAILAVMAYHLSLAPAKGGFLGVDLFFVLSGYLITSSLVAAPDLVRFYKRRARRILPPLLAAVVLAAVLNPVEPAAIAAGLFFYANFLTWKTMGAVAHLWSLAIEEHFYLLWPLVFLYAGAWRARLLWAVVLGALALRIAMLAQGVDNEWVHKLSPARADALAIGCLVALQPKAWGWGGSRASIVSLGAIAACFALVTWPGFWLLSFGFTAFAGLCAVAILSLLGAGDSPAKQLLTHPLAQWIGRRSYGLYLYHWPIYMAVNATGLTVQWGITCMVAKIVLTAGVTELSFRYIEGASPVRPAPVSPLPQRPASDRAAP